MSRSFLKHWGRSLRHGLAFYTIHMARFLISKLSHQARRNFAKSLAKLVYALPGPRRIVTSHLETVFLPTKTRSQIDKIAQANFVHMAESITELLWWMTRSPMQLGRYIDIQNAEEIHKALTLGKGVIGLTSHLGNWELLGGYISNFVLPISVIAEPVFDTRVNQVLVDARTHLGVSTIYRQESGRSLLKVLRSGGFVGMLADQDIPSSESIFVTFFGRPALTPVGPASISIHTGAPLVPMFIKRLHDGSHCITVGKAIIFERTQDLAKDIHDLTQLWSNVVEKQIAANPEQWMWLHDRFASKPEGAAP